MKFMGMEMVLYKIPHFENPHFKARVFGTGFPVASGHSLNSISTLFCIVELQNLYSVEQQPIYLEKLRERERHGHGEARRVLPVQKWCGGGNSSSILAIYEVGSCVGKLDINSHYTSPTHFLPTAPLQASLLATIHPLHTTS